MPTIASVHFFCLATPVLSTKGNVCAPRAKKWETHFPFPKIFWKCNFLIKFKSCVHRHVCLLESISLTVAGALLHFLAFFAHQLSISRIVWKCWQECGCMHIWASHQCANRARVKPNGTNCSKYYSKELLWSKETFLLRMHINDKPCIEM